MSLFCSKMGSLSPPYFSGLLHHPTIKNLVQQSLRQIYSTDSATSISASYSAGFSGCSVWLSLLAVLQVSWSLGCAHTILYGCKCNNPCHSILPQARFCKEVFSHLPILSLFNSSLPLLHTVFVTCFNMCKYKTLKVTLEMYSSIADMIHDSSNFINYKEAHDQVAYI